MYLDMLVALVLSNIVGIPILHGYTYPLWTQVYMCFKVNKDFKVGPAALQYSTYLGTPQPPHPAVQCRTAAFYQLSEVE